MITVLKMDEDGIEMENYAVWCKRLRNFCSKVKLLKHDIQDFFNLTASTTKSFCGEHLKVSFLLYLGYVDIVEIYFT